MTKKFATISLIMFSLCVILFGYMIVIFGIFNSDTILVTTLATTGPNYKVILGQSKLNSYMPDSLDDTDVSGIMVSELDGNGLPEYLNKNYQAFGDYFIVNPKFVGIKQSDSSSYHPLIEITSWEHISKVKAWGLSILDFAFFALFWLFYKKYKMKMQANKKILSTK
jgi:hypothetical protein